MKEVWTGGCQCGALRYEIDAARIETLYCCHCTECQKQSASAFGMSMKLPPEALRLTRGELAHWERLGDSGDLNAGVFCRDCGTRLYHHGGRADDWLSLKAGSLDNARQLAPVGHIWTDSAQSWVVLDRNLLLYKGQPDSFDALCEAWRGRHET